MRFRTTLFAFFDLLIVAIIFSLFLYSKPTSFVIVFSEYLPSFLIFIGLWAVISIVFKKYSIDGISNLRKIVGIITIGNLLIVGSATTLMYLVRVDFYSRTVVFGTILIATFVELLYATFSYYLQTATLEQPDIFASPRPKRRTLLKEALTRKSTVKKQEIKSREKAILVEIEINAFNFIFSYARIDSPETLVISTTSEFNIRTQLKEKFETIVNLKRVNDIRYANKFLEAANAKLPLEGLFIGFVETKNLRKKRILGKFFFPLNYIAYTLDFIVKRLFPKFLLTKGIYFFLTRGQNRVFTKAEIFGRLYSCGFEIVDEKHINKNLYFIARKISEPHFPTNPTYGPFIKLNRIGYKGKSIKVYKLRTMHPYAEYLQEYIYQKEGLQEGGKFKSDFRISTLGKFLRMFWLDELPMLFNLLRGELKLVGVRPLSPHYLSLYSEELKKRRLKYKPGLIPPFYSDNPKTLDEIMESERRYMDAYDKKPLFTDIKYFFIAFYNILFRKYRSK